MARVRCAGKGASAVVAVRGEVVRLPLLLVMAGLALAPAAQGAIVIQGDTKLGRFAVQRDGALQGAIDAFGDPSTLRGHPDSAKPATPAGARSAYGSPSTTSAARTHAGRSGVLLARRDNRQ